MSDQEQGEGEKSEEPSQQRIDDFREKGQVSYSKELNSIIILLGSFLGISLSLGFIYENFHTYISWISSNTIELSIHNETFNELISKTAILFLKSIAPVLIISLVLGVSSQIMQIGILFSPKIIEFKWERLDPMKGIQKLISMKSIVEVAKGIFKFAIIISITYLILKEEFAKFPGLLHLNFIQSFIYSKDVSMKLGFSTIIGLFILAIFDFAYEKYTYHQKILLTKHQAKEETKEKEGNPEVKQRIRSLQREMANKRMMNDVKTADVIVANPTHISVALKYLPEEMVSPKVTGIGTDHLALKMRTIAKEHNIPIVENIKLARALYKTSKMGDYVPHAHYKAVAEILAFVYKLKRKNKMISGDVVN